MEFIDGKDGEVLKKSGRKGRRLSSIIESVKRHGKIHPQFISDDNEVEAVLLKHSDYEQDCADLEHYPAKELTQGVKSGLTHRNDIEFGFNWKGREGQYMVIPASDTFSSVITEAQQVLNEALED